MSDYLDKEAEIAYLRFSKIPLYAVKERKAYFKRLIYLAACQSPPIEDVLNTLEETDLVLGDYLDMLKFPE